jgi:hypothetical protein
MERLRRVVVFLLRTRGMVRDRSAVHFAFGSEEEPEIVTDCRRVGILSHALCLV